MVLLEMKLRVVVYFQGSGTLALRVFVAVGLVLSYRGNHDIAVRATLYGLMSRVR